LFLGLVIATLAVPIFDKEKEEGPQNAYEINPHFGFRRYFEMRYEPLSVPYTQPAYAGSPSVSLFTFKNFVFTLLLNTIKDFDI